MKIVVLVVEGVFDTGLSTVLDALTTANELADLAGSPGPRFDVSLVGVRSLVRSAQGLSVPVMAVAD